MAYSIGYTLGKDEKGNEDDDDDGFLVSLVIWHSSRSRMYCLYPFVNNKFIYDRICHQRSDNIRQF